MIDTLQPGHTTVVGLDPDLMRRELRLIERALAAMSTRLDAAGRTATMGDGVAVMALDQASQAVHLALLELQACLEVA